MKRKKKKEDERLGSMLNAGSTHSSRRQVGAMGTITSIRILFFAGFLISETSGFVVDRSGRMNPVLRKAIKSNFGTMEMTRNE